VNDKIKHLVMTEVRRNKSAFIWTALFFVFYGALVASMTATDYASDELPIMLWTQDLFFVAVMQILGFIFTKEYFSAYWRTNYFQSKWKWLRSFPITAEEMIKSRMVLMRVAVIYNTLMFFIPYCLMNYLILGVPLGFQSIWFAAIWAGFGLLGSGFNMYLEYIYSGRIYFYLNIIVMLVVFVPLVVIFNITSDHFLVPLVYEWAGQSSGVFIALGSLVAGLLGFEWWGRKTIRRINGL
jgi:hypothetical protein